MKKIATVIILCFAFSADNVIQTESYNVFILDTEDINNNGINDALTFSGENLKNKASIFDLRQKGLSKIWDYTLSEQYIGFFTDAVFADLNGNGDNELILIASLTNTKEIFFLFTIKENTISKEPIKISQLPGNYSKTKNPKNTVVLDWDNDNDLEFGISFTSPDRKVLICDYENREFLVLDEIGNDFLPNTYAPIMISAGDFNGDNKDDLIIIDNGAQANARIYINEKSKEGVRILGLKDVGHLSYLSSTAVDFDNNRGSEIFCSSVSTGLHYIFVETIGTTNQAVTVKTELLGKAVNEVFFGKTTTGQEILTTHPDGTIGRYEIKKTEGDLTTGIFETNKINFTFNNPRKTSGIYFPKDRTLMVSGIKEEKSEIFIHTHKTYIEPTINFNEQRTDKRVPNIILSVNNPSNTPLVWVDTLSFIDFTSNNLSEGMVFSDDGKMIKWTPTLNQLGIHDIVYSGRFRHQGKMTFLQEDSAQTIKLVEDIIAITDSLLIYVNDPPVLDDNENEFLTVSGKKFEHKFNTQDRNIDKQLHYYFILNDTSGITVSDSGLVEWISPNNFYGYTNYMLYVSDGIEKDSININFKVHPAINLSSCDTSFIIQPGKLFTAPFQPTPTYTFNQYSYSLVNAPENMHIDLNGNITWTPIPSQVDRHRFTVKVEDGITETELEVSIYVNSPPIISSNPPTTTFINQEQSFSYTLGSYDANEDAKLSWYLVDGPEGMWMDSTGVLTWTSNSLDYISYIIELSDNIESTQYTGKIYTNATPKITSDYPQEINYGDTLIYEILSEDQNTAHPFDQSKNNILQHIIIDGPKTAEINSNNKLIWVPSKTEIGETRFSVAASDGLSREKQNIEIYVNHIPTINSPDSISLQLNKKLFHIMTAQDLNKESKIEFEILDNLNSINLKNDTLTWIPDSTNLGKTLLKIQATDGYKNSVSIQTLNIFVYILPEFSNSAPKEAFVGVEYNFTPEVVFMEKDTLNNNIILHETTSKNIQLDSTGNIKWYPNEDETGIQQMTFQAIDRHGLKTTATYTIGVKENPYTQETQEPKKKPAPTTPKEESTLPNPIEPSPVEEETQPPSGE